MFHGDSAPGVGGRWHCAAFLGSEGQKKAAATSVRSAVDARESTLAYAERVPVLNATRVQHWVQLILEV